MSQAFYRKWRPSSWEEVLGQEHIVQTLRNAIRSDRVGHAYLFAGPRGTGKTTTARLLAKAVNCLAEDLSARPCNVCENCTEVNRGSFLDLIEIDAASNTSVDDVRELRDKINFSPTKGRFKVYIIDEVHMLSTAAFNALLKTLEEPPRHAIFVLATTEVNKIPATVLSRCQRHEFRRIPVEDIVVQLNAICQKENLEAEKEVLTLIARQATGSMRDAISLLDQLASSGEKITLTMAQNVLGTATSQIIIDLVTAILAKQSAQGLQLIHQALDCGTDPRQLARQMVDYLRSVLLIRMGNEALIDTVEDTKGWMKLHAKQFKLEQLLENIRLFNQAATETRGGWQPGLLLELATAEAVEWSGQASESSAPQKTTEESQKTGVSTSPPISRPHEVPSQKDISHTNKPSVPVAETPQKIEPTQPASETQRVEEVSLKEVTSQWNNIRALVKKQRPSTEALLNSCKPLLIKDGVLHLGFRSNTVKTKMESEEHMDLARSAITEIIGKDLSIRCVVLEAKTGGNPGDLNVEGDGMVSTALNLGGQIVHKE
jgi:DNA polymerase III subunit gamma/tau